MQRSSFDILFVEDDPSIREVVLEVLILWGYTITALGSAESAMACLAHGRRYAVLITDVTLPGASGIDLAKQAYALNSTIRIIFTTGDGYLLAPPLPFPFTLIAKPFNLARLREAIQIGLTGAAKSIWQ